MDRFEYQYDEIVLGGNLAALMTAYYEGFPVFWEKPEKPLFFDETEEGESKEELWERYAFLLSVCGLCPFADKVERYEIKDESTVRIFGAGPFYVDIKCNKIHKFDDPKEAEYFQVIDWVDVKSGMRHDVDLIKTGDRFVSEIVFYPSIRLDGNHSNKDLFTISYLTEDELRDPDYSETYIRLKTLGLMKENGIRGTSNGFYAGKQRYLRIRIEPVSREVRIVDTAEEDELIKKYRSKFPNLETVDRMAAYLGEPFGIETI